MVIGIDGNEANVKNRVGTGVYTLQLLKQFQTNSLKQGSYRFEVFLKEKPLVDLPPETAGFKYKIFGPKKFWTQFALSINLTVGQKPDVFFSPAHYGPRFSKVPYVVTIHDLSYLRFPELFRREDLVQLTNWSKYSIEKSSAIIVPSKCTKADIVQNYKVSADKVTVVYEGYNKEAFKSVSTVKIASVKKKYKIVGDYVIFVGTLQPRKNIERLIEAFASLVNQKLEVGRLVIAGKKGWMYDQILTKAKEQGLEDKVIFTDFVPDVDLPALMAGAKAYINPSLWEGFGIPVIEAQACGVPVIVSGTSSLPEIVGNSGLLIDPQSVPSIADGIKKIVRDEKLQKDLVKKGHENIRRFSWEACALETLNVLTRFASK